MSKEEKYGFVYIWRDRKYKRFYIGAHWGTENDGYVCSSNWMKQAYKHRPEDFKRKILKRIYTSKTHTFIEEQKWLNMIKSEEVKIRYYNLHTIVGHWTMYPENIKTIRQKISLGVQKTYDDGLVPWNKDKKMSLEFIEKNRQSHLGLPAWNKGISLSDEQKEKQRKKMLGRPAWNKGMSPSEEQRQKQSNKMKGKPAYNKGVPATEEQKKKNSNAKYGREWYYNKETDTNINPKIGTSIPEGFIKGRRRRKK